MRLITRNDIETWAEQFDSKGYLPILISRLVIGITPKSTFVDFPSGSSAFIGGWDGIVKCNEERNYVPQGISLWEFGTENNSTGKANDDYNKRTKDPLGYDISTSTFIFITPRYWKFKDKWRQEKLKEGKWKDVKVYDSVNLEQWLDIAPAVSRWFSIFIKGYPSDGILTVERFWKEWSWSPLRELPPNIVTIGREYESNQLLDFLNNPPGIKAIKASSKDEAIAFIIASAKQFELKHSEDFFSKSLIIDTSANFRSISINKHALNLIARIEEISILYGGVADGHHVIVPLGPDDKFNQDIIELPMVDRDGQIESLMSIGLSREDATKYSKECARNITILKRLLKFPQNKLEWAKPENVREIIPAMLLGRWDENKKGDREIIEKLSGEKYNDYILKIIKWRDSEVSPFIQIGNTWRLTSPLDAWSNLSLFVLKNDLDNLKESFLYAFKNGNPPVDPDPGSSTSSFLLRREFAFSDWAREGLIQSLILIGLYGEGLKIPNIAEPQLWVDNIIHLLLSNAEGHLWVSLNREMPLIAEASPTSFFENVYTSLSKDDSPIMYMFIEKESFMSSTSSHTGLLWALEGLAWMPDYLYNAALILTKLTSFDSGIKINNRPINSLTEIFKPWHYQTLASFDERMQVLKEIASRHKEIAWILLIRMLPDHHGIAHPTHKMRWRMFEKSFDNIYTYQEVADTHSYVVDLLLSIFDHSENKFSQLINESFYLIQKDRDTILEFAELELSKIIQIDFVAWHTLRKTLSNHISHSDTDWALSKKELSQYKKILNKLEPIDVIQKHVWLFDEQWPAFPEGDTYDEETFEESHKQQQKKIDNKRIEGLKIILAQYGIKKIEELSKTVKEPGALGDSLAKIIEDESEVLSLCKFLNNEKESLSFIHSFIFRKTLIYNLNWGISLFKKLQEIGYSSKALAQIFIPLIQSSELWIFIDSTNEEIKKEYWLSINPHFYGLKYEEKIIGLNYLINYRRFFSAIDICSHFPEELPTELIIEILEKAVTEEANENIRLHGFKIGHLFKSIDDRTDIDNQKLIQLEWLFLPILDAYQTNRTPKILHQELAKNPEFFIDVLKWVYMPKNKVLLEAERNGLDDNVIKNRAIQAGKLLRHWKNIPGMSPDNLINNEFLQYWISRVRELAEKADRLEVADMAIGQILAQYPEKDLNWPPDEICNIIETINTDSLKRNFSSAIFNKRGSSTRGPFDGGNIERNHAAYFETIAARHKNKFPIVASILARLAKGYLEDAKDMDERAERDRLEY